MSFLQRLKDLINPGEAKQRRICAEFLSILSGDPYCQQLCKDALAETQYRLYEIPKKDLEFLEGIINLYTMLADEKSRLLLAKVVTYKLVEKGKYKFGSLRGKYLLVDLRWVEKENSDVLSTMASIAVTWPVNY